MPTTRRDFLLSGTAALAGMGSPACASLAGGEAGGEPTDAPPNILLIMVDEMPFDVMGCAGHATVQTPHLDALARTGLRFERAYTAAPICRPARHSIFTGRYAHVHGVIDNKSIPEDGEIVLPSILKHHGYDTAICGKLHFLPAQHSYDFDEFWSYQREGPPQHERYPDYLKRKHGSAELHPFVPGTCPYPDDPLGRDIGKFAYPLEDFLSFWTTDRSIEYLRTRKKSGRPWFLFTSYLIPHTPYRAPEPYFSMYDPSSFEVPAIPPEVAARRSKLPPDEQRHCVADEGMLRALTAQFFGHVTNADDNIGRLLSELSDLRLESNTIVVFTSDHGNMLGDRGLYLKGVMYERATRVPLIVRAPARGADLHAQQRTQDALVSHVDLVPTLLELAGLPLPQAGLQGVSFAPLLLSGGAAEQRPPRTRCYAERSTRMVRTERHKLIETLDDGRCELYDLHADPAEGRDLGSESSQAELIAELAGELRRWRAQRPEPVQIRGMSLPGYAVLSAADRERHRVQRASVPEDD